MVAIEPITRLNVLLFKEVRLRALEDSPGASDSTYAKESQFADSEWMQRVERWNRKTGFNDLGNLEKGLEEHREALRLEPNAIWNYGNLGSDYTGLNRLDEAEVVFRQAEDRKLSGYLLVLRRRLAFLNGDEAQMVRLAAAAVGEPGAEDRMLGVARKDSGRRRADPAGYGFRVALRRPGNGRWIPGRRRGTHSGKRSW
jgi:hypothetical protein